jgi:hypothetical protein
VVKILVVTVAQVVAVAELVDNMEFKTDHQVQRDLVVLGHKVVMDLVDTQEQVAVQVPHLELLVTLV